MERVSDQVCRRRREVNSMNVSRFSNVVRLQDNRDGGAGRYGEGNGVRRVEAGFPPTNLYTVNGRSRSQVRDQVPCPNGRGRNSCRDDERTRCVNVGGRRVKPRRFPRRKQDRVTRSMASLLFRYGRNDRSVLNFLVSSVSSFIRSNFSMPLPGLEGGDHPRRYTNDGPPAIQ